MFKDQPITGTHFSSFIFHDTILAHIVYK